MACLKIFRISSALLSLLTVLFINIIFPTDFITAQQSENEVIIGPEMAISTELECYSCMRMEDNSTTKDVDMSFFMAVFANSQHVLTKCKHDSNSQPKKLEDVRSELKLTLANRSHVRPWLWMTPALLSDENEGTEGYTPYCMALTFSFKETSVIVNTFHYMHQNFTHSPDQNQTCLDQDELAPHKVLADDYITDGLNGSAILAKLAGLDINVRYKACFCNEVGCNGNGIPVIIESAGHRSSLAPITMSLLVLNIFIVSLFNS